VSVLLLLLCAAALQLGQAGGTESPLPAVEL